MPCRSEHPLPIGHTRVLFVSLFCNTPVPRGGMDGIQRWGWRCWSSSMSTHGGSQLFLALLRLHLDDFIFRWLLESNVEGGDVDQRGLQPMAAASLCSSCISSWRLHIHMIAGIQRLGWRWWSASTSTYGYPTSRAPICYICTISHIHAPQDCYKIVPCNSNVVDFVIFKLQHLSVFIKRTYTLELDVKIFLLMYKCLFYILQSRN